MEHYITPKRFVHFLLMISILYTSCIKEEHGAEAIRKESLQTSITKDSVKNDGKLQKLELDSNKLKVVNPKADISPTNSKEKPLTKEKAGNIEHNNSNKMAANGTLGIMSYSVGSSISGNYYGTGSYTYPSHTLDLTSTSFGTVITVNCTSYDVPNKFEVYDQNGNLVVNSGWMGYASYFGPWGSSLNTPQSKIIRFIKSGNTFSLKVTTVTQNYSDSWEASVGSQGAFDSKFSNIGNFHNAHLSNANNNFNPISTNTYEGDINLIRDFNKNYFVVNQTSYLGYSYTAATTNSGFETVKYFSDYNSFRQNLLNPSHPSSLTVAMNKINSIPSINTSNKQLLEYISSAISSNLNGYTTNASFNNSVYYAVNQWLQINSANEQTISAKASGTVLTICLKSSQWWSENPTAGYDGYSFQPNKQLLDSLLNSTASSRPLFAGLGISLAGRYMDSKVMENYYFAAPWVAADAAGALVGMAWNAYDQYSTTGSIGGDGLAGGALRGGLMASTGAVGRLGRFLSRYFK